MNSQQILQISLFGLFVGGYSLLALFMVGRAVGGGRVLAQVRVAGQNWKARASRLRRAVG
jgi:hypothetical protein